MRSLWIFASIAAATMLLAACGDGPDKPAPTATATLPVEHAGPIQGLPVSGMAVQELEFNGVVEGSMSESSANCAWLRSSSGGPGRFQMSLRGLVGDSPHTLRVVVHEYDGPGDYSWDGVKDSGPEVNFEMDGTETGHGTIFIDETGAGEIDATISSPDQGRIHGLFQCPGVPR